MAAEARRRNGAAVVARLEDRLDDLHAAVADAARHADDRVRDARLAGLAELAAGAGHEINNPLAVIAGQAQRLLAMADDAEREPDPDRDAAAAAIHRHALRAHGIIRDLMQFARPTRPDPRRFTLTELFAAVRGELADLAAGRSVRLELAEPAPELWADGDAGQLRRAVVAVARNGVEAAPSGGWVRIMCEADAGGVAVVVEDSGPGVDPAHRDSLFDPFFCGRAAGRRLGLGLPTAWRIARLNGGDVRFDPRANGPTRFVVTMPRAAETQFSERKSA
jgi:signal transduction histidine kinase